MKAFASAVAMAAISVALAACQTQQQQISNKEDNLVAAGFKFVPVNTPERQAMFRTLPPNRFSRQMRGDRVVYVYPDPVVCHCLYVGNQQAYGTYRQNQLQKRIADENQMAADEMSMASWDWGPWAVGYYPGWPYY
jgi:hypothetical protein